MNQTACAVFKILKIQRRKLKVFKIFTAAKIAIISFKILFNLPAV